MDICAQMFGGGTKGAAMGVAVDGDRNVYIAGLVETDLVFGTHTIYQLGERDAFVVSFAHDGTFRWAKRWGGGTTLAGAYGVAVDASGNIYITGGVLGTVDFGGGALSGSGMFVASFDKDGNYRWARLDGGGDGGFSIAVTGSNVYVLGSFLSSMTLAGSPSVTLTSAGNTDAVVASFTASGDLRWAQRLGGAYTDSVGGIVAQPGWIALSWNSADLGSHLASWTEDGSSRWDVALVPAPLDLRGVFTDGTAVYLSGMHVGGTDVLPGTQPEADGWNRYIHAYTADDDTSRWSWTLNESPAYHWTGLPYTPGAIGAHGDVVLAGTYMNTLDAGGTPLANGNETLFVATFAADSTGRGAVALDDHQATGGEYANGIAVDSGGVQWLVGDYFGTPNFGDGALAYAPEGGILILRR